MSVLYLSYDGLMEQLGQSQVFPYLRELAHGRRITLVTFEKSVDLDDAARRARFAGMVTGAGVRWIPLRYHRTRPATLGTAYDIAIAFAVCAFQSLAGRARIVHARGYVASVVALALKRLLGARFIFDMRGFWVDQRVELGIWRGDSTLFRIAKWLETRFLREADVVFALAAGAVAAMKEWPACKGRAIQFEVVTTCTDIERFTAVPTAARRQPADPFVLGYVGNAGPGYLFGPVVELYLAIRRIRPDARLRLINRNDHELIEAELRRHRVERGSVELSGCDHDEVPVRMRGMSAGAFFVRPDPSRISSVPTRMGEFLACGIPCVGSAVVAGSAEVLAGEGVGVVLADFSPEAIARAAQDIVTLAGQPDVEQRCVGAAQRHFSLAAGVAVYERVYRQLEGAAS